MCDYSLTHVASHPATVGEKLIVKNFGTGTTGFGPASGENVAVCLLPGTEIAFDQTIRACTAIGHGYQDVGSNLARFRQINKDQLATHHDAIELPDGMVFMLNLLEPGLTATVLQLPATPKTAEEAKDQERVAIVA